MFLRLKHMGSSHQFASSVKIHQKGLSFDRTIYYFMKSASTRNQKEPKNLRRLRRSQNHGVSKGENAILPFGRKREFISRAAKLK